MAGKRSGLGAALWIGGYDVGASTNSLSRIAGGNTPIEMTDITQEAMAREGGQRTGGMDVVSYWNPDAGGSHDAYATLPRTDALATYVAYRPAIGTWSANVVGKQLGYDGNRDQSGAFLLNVTVESNGYGLSWAQLATAGLRADAEATAAGDVDSLDLGSASPGAYGLVMFVHLIELAGGDIEIKLQESSDDGADTYADVTGATTGELSSARQGLRIATGPIDVERYLKVVTDGDFADAVFGVAVYRHRIETAY
jgi:hypothetical protein